MKEIEFLNSMWKGPPVVLTHNNNNNNNNYNNVFIFRGLHILKLHTYTQLTYGPFKHKTFKITLKKRKERKKRKKERILVAKTKLTLCTLCTLLTTSNIDPV